VRECAPPTSTGPSGYDGSEDAAKEDDLVIEPEVTERIPLRSTQEGAVLVEGTRVPLDLLVEAFNGGNSAEEIVMNHPTLELADVYAILAYYLRHRADVDAYAARRRAQADALRARIESQFDPRGIRERLLARRKIG
jgi:uncharacterized protein (DUF433 family)